MSDLGVLGLEFESNIVMNLFPNTFFRYERKTKKSSGDEGVRSYLKSTT